jgi:PAS domain S-box-containing protein
MADHSYMSGRFNLGQLASEHERIERREWWLWSFAVAITLLLTVGIASFSISWLHVEVGPSYWYDLREWIRALAGLVLLFDIYTLYQQLQLQRLRRRLIEGEQLFRLISENAADMIAVVDMDGRRLYNSPAYEKVLGYSAAELESGDSLEHVHPDDRQRVIDAAEMARVTGRGQRIEYRMRHRDASWRDLESTANVVRDANGTPTRLVIVNRDITDRKRAEAMLAHNAFHDGLTNLPNRALFADRLQHALTISKRHTEYKFAVLHIDVDEFKLFNDSLGHESGDALLVHIGKTLQSSIRRADSITRKNSNSLPEPGAEDDRLARLGSDEFTVLLDDIREPSDAVRVAERLQTRLARPLRLGEHEIVLSASVGIALSNSRRSKAEEVLRDAEIAMHRAKLEGKARCVVFDPAMHASAINRLTLEADLRQALASGDLRPYYQPIVSLETRRIVGFEALTRWQRPDRVVYPGEFIPVADESGLILEMNRLLTRQAAEQIRQWNSQFSCNPPLTMSVNVAPKQFADPGLASDVRQILQDTAADPATLRLEITETIAMSDADKAADVLVQLKSLGVGLSLDDFGNGYSSLIRLRNFPFDTLKIDRAFISNIDRESESSDIVKIILLLAHNFGLKVVAEGVETQEQVTQISRLGCELAQGYLFSRPVDQSSASQLLADRARVF